MTSLLGQETNSRHIALVAGKLIIITSQALNLVDQDISEVPG